MPLADALKSMKRANSGLTWIRQKHVTVFLRKLAVAPEVTDETFDELPTHAPARPVASCFLQSAEMSVLGVNTEMERSLCSNRSIAGSKNSGSPGTVQLRLQV
jgi:hypothetical protein